MRTNACQRWRQGRDSYRPAGEVIDPRRFDVAPILDDATARAFVEAHHYSGSFPAARRRFGLYRSGYLVGVAVYSVPMSSRVLTTALACAPGDAVELGRFVLLDGVEANGESWFLARTFEALRREGFAGVVSFSDPQPRSTSAGDVIYGGHIGTIYQATNARYVGRGTARTLRLLPDGQVFSARAAAKIRARDQGCAYAAAQLVKHGAEALADDEDAGAWLRRWLHRLTRSIRHQGNHKYAWSWARRGGWAPGVEALAYPKLARQRALSDVSCHY